MKKYMTHATTDRRGLAPIAPPHYDPHGLANLAVDYGIIVRDRRSILTARSELILLRFGGGSGPYGTSSGEQWRRASEEATWAMKSPTSPGACMRKKVMTSLARYVSGLGSRWISLSLVGGAFRASDEVVTPPPLPWEGMRDDGLPLPWMFMLWRLFHGKYDRKIPLL